MARILRVRAEDVSLRIRVPARPSALVPGVLLPEETVWLTGDELRVTEIEIVSSPAKRAGPGLAKAVRRTRVSARLRRA